MIFNDISAVTSKQNSFYSNLEEFKSDEYSLEGIKALADDYHKQIKRYETQFGCVCAIFHKTKAFNNHLIQLSRFENLQSLELSICANGFINEELEIIANY